MKSTNQFQKTIQTYLEQRAAADELFAQVYAKRDKSIEDCILYILNTVSKSGCNGFTDDEIFGMAIHYYDEDNIEVGKPMNSHVVVNHVVELTEEEIEETRIKARKKAEEEAFKKLMKQKEKRKEEKNNNQQASLFDF